MLPHRHHELWRQLIETYERMLPPFGYRSSRGPFAILTRARRKYAMLEYGSTYYDEGTECCFCLAAALAGLQRSARRRVFVVVGLLARSHFVLDGTAHVVGLPLLGDDSPKFALELWN